VVYNDPVQGLASIYPLQVTIVIPAYVIGGFMRSINILSAATVEAAAQAH
jgi:hypothetical protein